MPVLTVLLVLIAVGVLLWLVNMIPMDPTIHMIIRAVVIILVVLWLLRVFGLMDALGSLSL